MKKFLSVLLVIIMLFSTVPFSTFATELEIESIVVEPLEIIEGTNLIGEWKYNITPKYITVIFKDGTIVSGDIWDIRFETGIYLGCYSFQSQNNRWGVGEYTATIYYGDVSTEYIVSIIENPIQSIVVDPVRVVEGDVLYVAAPWEYDIEPQNITVTLKDGNTVSGDRGYIEKETGCKLFCNSDQSYENQWGLGDHTATIHFGFVSAEYTITIIENPIQSIVVDPVLIMEGTGRWVDYDGEDEQYIGNTWMEYDIEPENIIVTLKDGSTVSGDRSHIEKETGCKLFCNAYQSYENQWGVGDHIATIRCGYVKAEYTVSIVEETIIVAKIGDVSYEILSEAFAAAGNGDTISLQYDFTVPCDILNINGGVTLDLNGHVLATNYFVGFAGSAVIDGSDANTGKLVAPKDCVVLDTENNGYMPVYDGEGYIFSTLDIEGAFNKNDASLYQFLPEFKGVVNSAVANGAESSGTKIVVRLSWTDNTYTAVQNFYYTDDFVKQVMTSYNTTVPNNYASAFKATFKRADVNVTEFTVTAVVLSDTGVEMVSQPLILVTNN